MARLMLVMGAVGVALASAILIAPSPSIDFSPDFKRKTSLSSSSLSSFSLPYSVESLVRKYFSQYGEEVVRQALLCVHLESRGDTNAVSKNGTYVGLWQMGSRWGTFKQRANPEWSTRMAAKAYGVSKWRHWPPVNSRVGG